MMENGITSPTFTAGERQMRHFVDGRLQPLPAKGSFLPLMGELVSMRVGRDLEGTHELEGLLDEMRISDVLRYRSDFTPPGSFSRNYGSQPPAKAVASGPPLLFGTTGAQTPLNLGSRKHLFIDDGHEHHARFFQKLLEDMSIKRPIQHAGIVSCH